MEVKFQVFVSSTFTDLQVERRVVMEQILNAGNLPVGMELFKASNDTQWNYIKRRIEQCDYFVVIVAERYGSVDDKGKSFTQREYEYAVEQNVPVAAFLLDEACRQAWPAGKVEADKKNQINQFRALVSQRLSKYWSDPRDLALYAGQALHELSLDVPRPGWIRADEVKFKGLEADNVGAKDASQQFALAVERDLMTTGYYRRSQTIEISCCSDGNTFSIHLLFEAELIPLRTGAMVFRPDINNPDGTELICTEYLVGESKLEKGGYQEIDSPTKDRLTVEYKTFDQTVLKVQDLHRWPSPVLDYCIVFQNKHGFELEVGKITGRKVSDRFQSTMDPQGKKEYKGRGAAFSSQGIWWKLCRKDS